MMLFWRTIWKEVFLWWVTHQNLRFCRLRLCLRTISKQDLGAHSAKANKALKYMTRSSGDATLDSQLWDKTLLEVSRGWMEGPLDWDQLPTGGICFLVASRCLRRGKVRPIDDLSQSQVNATVST